MAISSANRSRFFPLYGNTQFRYAAFYVAITALVLIFLNMYCSDTSQKLFYQSKESSMVERCQLAAEDFSQLEVLNNSSITGALSQMTSLNVTRIIVTDASGLSIFDSEAPETVGQLMLLPEIVRALGSNKTFSYHYHDGVIVSKAATPIFSAGALGGCVYMMEYDTIQGSVIKTLQHNILSTSVILEMVLILFSILFSGAFSQRLRRIMASMRIIREGDYSHKVNMGGNDELTILGEEFNDLTERLQTSENKRRQFVSDASHELKTPLASIKLLSDSILQNDMDMDTVKEFVGDIGNEADRLNRMTQKLLTLSRIETQEDGDCEIVLIGPTVDRVIRMLHAIGEKSGITISSQCDQDCTILILEDDLYQIIFNLVENGIKYNTPGGSLTITVRRDGDNAVIQVRDTGMGIPQDSLGHVFERFYRVDKARARKTGGSGLGLSIVRNMVERNGGTIGVDSILGQGSVFTVTFPIFYTEEEIP